MKNTQKIFEADNSHRKLYNPARLWQKIRRTATVAGRNTIETAFILYYTSTAKETPAWCKGVIYGALGYFISLIDGIPDLTPLLGYSDDFAVMAAAVATLTQYITPEIKQKARGQIENIFGPEEKKP
jgi:uncharacterized membrane protein YkvA (DUF1232 family)